MSTDFLLENIFGSLFEPFVPRLSNIMHHTKLLLVFFLFSSFVFNLVNGNCLEDAEEALEEAEEALSEAQARTELRKTGFFFF